MSDKEKAVGEQVDASMPIIMQNAALYHEFFTILMAVGFTEDQAIKFVVMFIINSPNDPDVT